jgi:hypothetical protein
MHRDGDERRLLGCGAGEDEAMTDLSDPRLIILRDLIYDYEHGLHLDDEYARSLIAQINRDLTDIDEELFRLKQLEK